MPKARVRRVVDVALGLIGALTISLVWVGEVEDLERLELDDVIEETVSVASGVSVVAMKAMLELSHLESQCPCPLELAAF